MTRVLGLHHVTAIGGDAQRLLDFHTGVLGLRLVKRTVNFDDPTGYHFYFGDATGAPGALLTLFPWGDAPRGRVGTGQAAVTALSIPPASLGFWLDRFAALGVRHELPARRFRDAERDARGADDGGETVVAFEDPDGLRLELATDPRVAALPGWEGAPGIPAEHAIRGLFGVTLWVEDADAAGTFLADAFGMRRAATEGAVTRWVADAAPDAAPDDAPNDAPNAAPGGALDAEVAPALGRVVDVRDARGFWTGAMGVGAVHHVAFRARDGEAQAALKRRVMEAGIPTTPVRDRHYFASVYFRAPGGVLYELATDGPGFAVDEPLDALGAALRLPPAFEGERAAIERALPPVTYPPRPPAAGAHVATSAAASAAAFAGAHADAAGAEVLP